MKRTSRVACHVSIVAWAFVWLAGVQPVSVDVPVDAAPAVLARVQPVATPAAEAEPEPEPEPQPEPQPEPEPEPEPAAEPEPGPQAEAPPTDVQPAAEPPAAPAPRFVGEADVASGGALLDGEGRFPVLSVDYDAFPSFRSYARRMTQLGARFVVVRQREIVGTIDLASGAVGRFEARGRYSPRARDYTGEPGLGPLAAAAKERFGERAIVMMLVPRRIDAGLFGGIARLLEERKQTTGDVREVRGAYERAPGGGIHLRVDAAVQRDGAVIPLRARFDLSAIARGGAA